MKKSRLLMVSGLAMVLGLGVAGGLAANRAAEPVQKVLANNTTVTVYCSILTSSLDSYKSFGGTAQRGSGDYFDFSMTEVERGITNSNRTVFMGSFTELYGGVDNLWFKYFDSEGSQIDYVQAISGWKTMDNFSNKVFNFEDSPNTAWSSYTIPTVYSLVGSDGSWETDSNLTSNGDGTYTISKAIATEEQFKIRRNHCWYEGFGFSNVTGTGAGNFVDSDGGTGNNFKCVLGGTYEIVFNPSTSSFVITDNTATNTYSYVLTLWNDYSCAYIYNSGSAEYTSWADSPSVSSLGGGIAYDIKLGYNSETYYGLYRISDRYLAYYSHLILKTSGSDSGKYTHETDAFDLSGTQKVYVCTNDGSPTSANSSSALYKAVDYAYDLLSHRGSATYDNHSFAYSICATSYIEANRLITNYEQLGSDAQAILANSSCLVYDLSGEYSEDAKTYRSIPDMVDALRAITAHNLNARFLFDFVNTPEGQSSIIIVIVSSIAALSFAGYFFLRRKKQK